MNNIYPKDACRNLGRKYLQIGRNQFKNDYIREVALQKPLMNDYLKVYIDVEDGFEQIVSEKIDENFESHIKKIKNFDDVFSVLLGKNKFFQILKSQKQNKDVQDIEEKGIMDYHQTLGEFNSNKSINPSLIKQFDNILMIIDQKVSMQESKGIMDFLESQKSIEDRQVHSLILDTCKLSDESIQNILKGLINQIQQITKIRENGAQETFIKQYFYCFVNSSNHFGLKSLEKLHELEQNIVEVKLNNILPSNEFNNIVKPLIIKQLIYDSPFLMKLSLSNINLNSKSCVENLVKLMRTKLHLQYLDLSWTYLTPFYMEILSLELIEMKQIIRDLNLSYNVLNFENQESAEYKSSQNFVKNIGILFEKSIILNHVNISGMKIERNNLMELCKKIIISRLIMSVHLNDNGISFDQEYMLEVLDIFGMSKQDIPLIKYEGKEKIPYKNKNQYFNTDFAHKYQINLNEKLQPYTAYQNPEYKENFKQFQDENNRYNKFWLNQQLQKDKINQLNQIQNNFNNYLVITKEYQNQMRQKKLNIVKTFSGVGRIDNSKVDCFTLTRVLNHPELIFNQKPSQDEEKVTKFFQMDAQSYWTLSKASECHICLKYMYTQIHYQRGLLAKNQELIEIYDSEILSQLKYQFKKDFLHFRTMTPLICGTIIKRNDNQDIFDRKLKMLRTSLYCQLAVCQCKSFSDHSFQAFQIKEGVQRYLKTDAYEILESSNVHQQLQGWQFILKDMALYNEVYSVKRVNMPDLSAYNLEKQEWFTFAGIFPPGLHQCLIYDPKTERAFYKDFVVGLNERDFVYPEYPIVHETQIKIIPNMWKSWIDDTDDDFIKIFQIDASSDKFRADKFIKDQDDMLQCMNILRDNLKNIIVYQKQLQIGSVQAPKIGFEQISQTMEEIQIDPNYRQNNPNGRLKRAQIELCFIGSTLNQNMGRLKGALQRAELLDFLLRLSQQFVKQVHSSKEKISNHLQYFLEIYLNPVVQKSKIFEHRKIIRSSRRLNEFLHDNNKGLTLVFNEFKKLDKNGFTLDVALQFFQQLMLTKRFKISKKEIETIYYYSQMTVVNEFKYGEKYLYLYFIEFQEMVCRAAIVGSDYEDQDTIEFKVQRIFDIIWDSQYQKGSWKNNSIPLIPIQQNLFF